MLIENTNLPDMDEAEFSQMPYFEFLKMTRNKSFKAIETIYEIQFQNFVQKVECFEMLGLNVSNEFNVEIQKVADYLTDEKNGRINQILSKRLYELPEMKENSRNLIEYYLNYEDWEDLDENEHQVLLTCSQNKMIADESRLSEEEKALTDINELSINEQIKLWAKLLDVSENVIKLMNNIQLDSLKVLSAKQYLLRLYEFKKLKLGEKENNTIENTITIGLPKLKTRTANDGITSLSRVQSAILIKILRKERFIFKDESLQTKENIYKAFQILTGYGKQGIKDDMNLKKYEESDVEVVQKFINKLNRFNMREL